MKEKNTDDSSPSQPAATEPHLRRNLTLLLLLSVSFGIIWIFASLTTSPTLPPVAPRMISPPVVQEPPAFTPELEAKLAQSAGFNALVSYTPSGFEPTRLVLEAGDTVRFTNNSDRLLHVVVHAEPTADDPCGTFDSCENLATGEFWEFTATQTGRWDYTNSHDPAAMGTLEVN